ncbi:hypothetical protein [Catenuloplanes atrovinosus]|uniref:Uncharacterized protein n=1 Tax=Catenuloplanes atrovinosus TaxID=137266 RepID=A0AAE3YMA1_9ACTN|nr:hypothetical protein [Catenuloplanes atrovinosus]MDR7275050.1 hypothetical protein [Catenuloplanes atrovinosus]
MIKLDGVTWSVAGGWTARWAAGAVLGQLIFGPTTMLFIALVTGVALGAGGMYLVHRRATTPRVSRPRRRTRAAVLSARLAALASRSRRALRRPRRARPAPVRRYSPRAPRRSFSPLAPR